MLSRRVHCAVATAVVLACPALAACGGDGPGPSTPSRPTPTFVSVPPDPADDPQLGALEGAIDESREQIAQPPGVSTEQLAALPPPIAELQARLGSEARVARVSMGQPAVTIRSGTKLTNWTRIPSRGLVFHPAPDYAQRLTWRFVVSTDSTPATVIADLDGSVVAVRWWQ